MMEERKENILIVHNHYQIPGGEDTVVSNEQKLLEKHGHKVITYSRHNNELARLSGLRKLFLPLTTIFNPRTFCDITKIIQEQHIDIVHVHNTLNLISPAVWYAAIMKGIPVVQTIHNFRMLCPGATFYRDGHICEDCVAKGLRCALRYRCYRGSSLQTLACVVNTWIHRKTGICRKLNYICLTEFNKRKILLLNQKKKIIDPEKVFVKPNFSDQLLIPRFCIERRRQVICVGRLERIKGTDVLLESWKHYGDDAPELILCGTGPLETWCRSYIQDNNLTKVQVCGFIEHGHLMDMIAESEALILPTQVYEGFPMAIAEAFSVGTPVVVPDFGNAGDLVEDGKTGAKYRELNQLTEAVKRVLGREDMRMNAYETYLEKYDPDANYRVLMNIYRAL